MDIKKFPKTKKLPSDIQAVDKVKNLYERYHIEKAGYKEISRQGTEETGYFTIWKHNLSENRLIFVELSNGFYRFGGYVNKK